LASRRGNYEQSIIDAFTVLMPMALLQVLSRYLSYRHGQDASWLSQKNILELGSGTGLVGLVVAMLDKTSRVVITDQE
jgi:predicted nicotinamide N-methyase